MRRVGCITISMRRTRQIEERAGEDLLHRREILRRCIALAGVSGLAVRLDAIGGGAAAQSGGQGLMDAKSEAKKIAFDRIGTGDKVLLISGFPQTRRSWNRLVPLLSQKFETIPADLPSFGDSGILEAPATTENAGRVFHEFVAGLGAPSMSSLMILERGLPIAGRCCSRKISSR
jgi:hypothetical protein